MTLAADLATMTARQTKARADYHDRTKDTAGNFRELGEHRKRMVRLMGGACVEAEIVCGCVRCSP